MVKRNEDAADSEVDNALAEALMEKLVAEIPEPMFEAETENYVRDYDSRLRASGLDLSTYFKYTGLTLDSLRQQMRPQAERQVKVRLALEKIAELEALTATEEEVAAEYEKISKAFNVPEEQVKNMIAKEDIEADIRVANAMKLVKDNAKITKPRAKKAESIDADAAEATEEKKPAAKKTATKSTTAKKSTSTKKKTAEDGEKSE